MAHPEAPVYPLHDVALCRGRVYALVGGGPGAGASRRVVELDLDGRVLAQVAAPAGAARLVAAPAGTLLVVDGRLGVHRMEAAEESR
ncbi:MAG: hypothetical protein D6739_00245 [Nitrospirae bacterium]|nr:MAG: hypothetical protein D6739_00245 [Nitrospirota bacterium]